MIMTDLSTARLWLRQWRESDLGPFAALNADPRVMEFMPGRLTRAESDALAGRSEAEIASRGFGFWATELRESGEFIGFVGLHAASFEAHFTPCIEIGWRLGHRSWGRGFATEAARECLRFAFDNLGLEEVVSFTVPLNRRSRAVMERLGMRRAAGDDFEHPRLPVGHPLRPHVLYRLQRSDWQAARAARGGATDTIDPAVAQRLVDRLRPADARLAGTALVETDQQLGRPAVMALQPAAKDSRGGEESRLHGRSRVGDA
jgi:RimJ/RimL family protein N-acetyltransferase